MAKNDEKYAYLNRLNTEQLEELLRMDMEMAEPGNEDVVFHILEVIEQREDEHPTGRIPDVDKAWAEFQEYYNIPEGVDASLYPCETEPDASSENPAEFSHPRRPRLHRWLTQGPPYLAGWSRPKRRELMCLVRLDAGQITCSTLCRQEMRIARPRVPTQVKIYRNMPLCERHSLLLGLMKIWLLHGVQTGLQRRSQKPSIHQWETPFILF